MTSEPVAVGIVFAVPVEADAWERRVTDRVEIRAAGLTLHEGRVAGRRVAWCVGGVGRERAAWAARLLVDGHRPRLLVSAGFAGGLDPEIDRGAIVEPAAVRGEDPARAPLPLARVASGGPTLVTVDRIVHGPAEKAALAAATGAALVDMETLAVAEVARESGLPCRAVRVISDGARDPLPPDVTRLVAPQSRVRRLGSLIGLVGRRPGAAYDLWQLWERAVLDARGLADAIGTLVASLPEKEDGPS